MAKDDKTDQNGGLVFLGFFIAIGLSVAGYFIGNTLYKARAAENTASVKGLAEREVTSDLAIWRLGFGRVGKELDAVYADTKNDRDIVIKFLKSQGFSDSEIRSEPLSSSRDVFREEGKVVDEQFNANTAVIVETSDVGKVVKAYENAGELVGQGVIIYNSEPRYLYTKLNDIKPELLGDATRNARVAAEQFAGDAGAKVGGIKYASQGTFSISAKNSTDSYGVDESSLVKNVRVVTSITFYME